MACRTSIALLFFGAALLSIAWPSESAAEGGVPVPAPSAAAIEPLNLKDAMKNLPKDIVTELILDASGSMKQKIKKRTKLLQAKRVLRSFMLEAQSDNMVMGLRSYGLVPKNCQSSKLMLKIGQVGQEAVDSAMEQIDPKGYGKTPLAYSLQEAAKDLEKFPGKPKRIIVVTDGIETCGGDPCAVAKMLKKHLDIRIFVVGFTLNEKDRTELACLANATGGAQLKADDEQSLTDAMKQLADNGKNLFVKSPEPLGKSALWQLEPNGHKKKIRDFISSMGVRVEPKVPYQVDVLLDPIFTFRRVVVAPREKKTLVVQGDGTVNFTFMDKLFTITLLNQDGRPVVSFPSDTPTQVPTGAYKVKAVSPPFAEAVIDDILVAPGSSHDEPINHFGAIRLTTGPDRGPGPFGFYVFDDHKKADLGSYLTGMPLVLPESRYTLKSVGNSLLKNVYPGTSRVRDLPLPPPGQTVTFERHKDDVEKPDAKKSKGPVMLDEMTPEQIQKHLEGAPGDLTQPPPAPPAGN